MRHATVSCPVCLELRAPLSSNKSFEDILLRDELQKYADEHSGRFKLWHILSSEPADEGFKVRLCWQAR